MIPYGGIAGISAFCRKENEKGLNFLKKYATSEEDIYLPIYEKNVNSNQDNRNCFIEIEGYLINLKEL